MKIRPRRRQDDTQTSARLQLKRHSAALVSDLGESDLRASVHRGGSLTGNGVRGFSSNARDGRSASESWRVKRGIQGGAGADRRSVGVRRPSCAVGARGVPGLWRPVRSVRCRAATVAAPAASVNRAADLLDLLGSCDTTTTSWVVHITKALRASDDASARVRGGRVMLTHVAA